VVQHSTLSKALELAKLHKDEGTKNKGGKFVDAVSQDRQVLHMKTVIAAHHFLTKHDTANAGAFASKAKELFPLSTYFKEL
jgi:hypothetical protein